MSATSPEYKVKIHDTISGEPNSKILTVQLRFIKCYKMENSSFSALPIGTVSAVFFSKEDAKKTHDYLIYLGHTDEEISMLMSDETLNKFQRPDAGNSLQVQETSPSYQKFFEIVC